VANIKKKRKKNPLSLLSLFPLFFEAIFIFKYAYIWDTLLLCKCCRIPRTPIREQCEAPHRGEPQAVKPFHQVGRHHDSYVAATQLMKHRHCKVLRRATVGAVPNATAESFKLWNPSVRWSQLDW